VKKIIVFIPIDYKESVKEAMFKEGAGQIGDYNSCSFEVIGEGQFRPLKGSKPFVGTIDEVEVVKEVRVEMVCRDELVGKVISSLKEAHPYEEPAFDIIELLNENY